jgi:hypothetical protein
VSGREGSAGESKLQERFQVFSGSSSNPRPTETTYIPIYKKTEQVKQELKKRESVKQ